MTRLFTLCVFAALVGACSGQLPSVESYARKSLAKDPRAGIERSARAKKPQRVARRQIAAYPDVDDIGAGSTSGARGKGDFQGIKKRASKKTSRRNARSLRIPQSRQAEHLGIASVERKATTIIRKKRRRIVSRNKRKRVVSRKRSRVTTVAKNRRGRRKASAAVLSAVKSHARRAGVPVSVGLAVVRQESSFNPKARGKVGEIGLMQVKCSTARGMGYRGKCSGLYNVNTNLRYGMKYLKKAINKGSVGYYNAGIGAKRLPAQARRYARSVARKNHSY